MLHQPLTAKYRPQTFTDVAGQYTIKSILSRAAQENRIAPAYLFSGTRGVGKTTVARIFAKALNCRTAPTAEPCNECDMCKAITRGAAVDVVEIDAASHTGVENIRSLKETVGYAPMDGRYKVFIIDEAHMLSKSAFNALLKTLEEPPARVTFIMATTEVHKFPITIVSRCQNYVFQCLSENELETHLQKVLAQEDTSFEAAATRLLARRAAGSVRDAMSLMAQVLALGSDTLSEQATRQVLGLAGQELMLKLMTALQQQDCLAITGLVRTLLDQGLDVGFFLRELATTWRTLFLIHQAGEPAISILDIPATETQYWLDLAKKFAIAHIHACWQMTLEGQRRVLSSLEPALALELLLINLALLPRIIPLASAARAAGHLPADQTQENTPPPSPATIKNSAVPNAPVDALPPQSVQQAGRAPSQQQTAQKKMTPNTADNADDEHAPAQAESNVTQGSLRQASNQAVTTPPPLPLTPSTPPTWDAFMRHCAAQHNLPTRILPALHKSTGTWQGETVNVTPATAFSAQYLQTPETMQLLRGLLQQYAQQSYSIHITSPAHVAVARDEIKQIIETNPSVQLVQEEFKGWLLDFGQQTPEK